MKMMTDSDVINYYITSVRSLYNQHMTGGRLSEGGRISTGLCYYSARGLPRIMMKEIVFDKLEMIMHQVQTNLGIRIPKTNYVENKYNEDPNLKDSLGKFDFKKWKTRMNYYTLSLVPLQNDYVSSDPSFRTQTDIETDAALVLEQFIKIACVYYREAIRAEQYWLIRCLMVHIAYIAGVEPNASPFMIIGGNGVGRPVNSYQPAPKDIDANMVYGLDMIYPPEISKQAELFVKSRQFFLDSKNLEQVLTAYYKLCLEVEMVSLLGPNPNPKSIYLNKSYIPKRFELDDHLTEDIAKIKYLMRKNLEPKSRQSNHRQYNTRPKSAIMLNSYSEFQTMFRMLNDLFRHPDKSAARIRYTAMGDKGVKEYATRQEKIITIRTNENNYTSDSDSD